MEATGCCTSFLVPALVSAQKECFLLSLSPRLVRGVFAPCENYVKFYLGHLNQILLAGQIHQRGGHRVLHALYVLSHVSSP
jgi:hypothetical protein